MAWGRLKKKGTFCIHPAGSNIMFAQEVGGEDALGME